MKKIIYYVATSLDGFIAGPDEDISQFIYGGKGVEKYQNDLMEFKTVIMGRKTYEFGYKFGLEPGQPAYPHMTHHIFSHTLQIEQLAPTVNIEPLSIDRVKEIKESSATDIYLCGGGQFSGWLLENGLVDQIKLKLNPITLGAGTRLFGDQVFAQQWELVDSETFEDSLLLLTYDLRK